MRESPQRKKGGSEGEEKGEEVRGKGGKEWS